MFLYKVLNISKKILGKLNTTKSNFQKINNYICIAFKKSICKKEIKIIFFFIYKKKIKKIRIINRNDKKIAYIKL